MWLDGSEGVCGTRGVFMPLFCLTGILCMVVCMQDEGASDVLEAWALWP